MGRGSGYHRIEEEASYVPIEVEVEQPIQGGMGREHEQLTGMQKIEKAITDLAEQNKQFMASQIIIQERLERQQNEKKGSDYESFIKLTPREFSGTTKLEEAEGWVRRIESIFVVMGATEDQKVNLATFMLKNEASYWWDTTKHLLLTPGEKKAIFWNPFVKSFYEKYFPLIHRKEKEREFILLKQDRMSVDDYKVKFTALSRFAHKFVQNEEDKCKKF
ncbi:uncharacterized protein LOC132286748 [Cornus florida]|uniref:uncharacterized protein LOC132286748 n=1 Tax=Cornus florida TaxID=4283 RepID=UPI00289D2168|nr:uncharacterized protein LOC132286748 [Cornus florida]